MERQLLIRGLRGGPVQGKRLQATGFYLYRDAFHPVRGTEVRGPRAAGGHREAGARSAG
jgi:hypothetical protein